MPAEHFRKLGYAGIFIIVAVATASAQNRPHPRIAASIPANVLLQIIRSEDERRWDDQLKGFLSDKDPRVRKRAALAAGRIGDDRAVEPLTQMLTHDGNNDVRQMAAFAIGEIESAAGSDTLIECLRTPDCGDRKTVGTPKTFDLSHNQVRARAVEALGKIDAALPETGKDRKRAFGQAILNVLRGEADRGALSDRLTIMLGLTAALRARPDGAGPVILRFLNHNDPRIVAGALNVLARLRLKDGSDRVRVLLSNGNPIVRANAARVLGAIEDKQSFATLLDRALHDNDLRVRVSAIRALGSLKDRRSVEPLLTRGNLLIRSATAGESLNELLEIASALGRMLPNTSDDNASRFLEKLHDLTRGEAVEVEVAFARIMPGVFQNGRLRSELARPGVTWRPLSRRAQGLAAIKEVTIGAATNSAGDHALRDAQKELADMLRDPHTPLLALPDILQAYASFKPADLSEVAENQLQSPDVIIRSTAAEILGNQMSSEANTKVLSAALGRALRDQDLNDAALAILTALGKQKRNDANEAIKTALDSSDHLIRRRAVALLKANGAGDFSNRIGVVQTRNTDADYRRAISRIGKKVTATVVTSRGSFTIEFLPEDAPLTVDNFIQLARKGFFNGQTIPRVVPNFVIQAGDPRGDTNGGPGYQIRCEINEVAYERAAVGMALSGKDTGGSQWFVTHSPQPHLDGGYTVFGRVVAGMNVVDRIARGDVIRRIVVNGS